MLISCAVTAQLICTYVFAYADCWFSGAAAHISISINTVFGGIEAFHAINDIYFQSPYTANNFFFLGGGLT